ncbi:MAG: glycoside hydrolase family 16 protein, partial [Acutalibacteraceae bacterium]
SASLRNYWATFDGIEPGSEEHWTKLYNDYGIKYGMLEARIMFPEQSTETDETWPAFWTTGGSAIGPEGELDSTDKTKNWPTAGEIDIAELFSKTYNMNQLVHYSPNYDGNHSTSLAGGYTGSPNNTANTVIRGTYHTYGIYYTDKIFMYYVDDVVCAVFDITSSQYDFFRKNPQFIFMNMAIGDMNSFNLGPNAAPNLTSAQMKVDYVRAYQATDGDYSHINIFSVPTDTACSASGTQSAWQPGTKALNFSNGVKSFNVKPNNKIDEGKYDVFLTGTKAYWTTGAFDLSIEGSTYTANADYSQYTASAETGEWYCDDLSTYVGTADIQNGSHNIQVNLNRTKDPKDAIGCILRALILVGKSSNEATVTIDSDTETPTVATTATTTTNANGTTTVTKETTTASTSNETAYSNFFYIWNNMISDSSHWEDADASDKYITGSKPHGNFFPGATGYKLNQCTPLNYDGSNSKLTIDWDSQTNYLSTGKYKLIVFEYTNYQGVVSAGKYKFTAYEQSKTVTTPTGTGTELKTVDFTNDTPYASYCGGKIKGFDVGNFELKDGANNAIFLGVNQVEGAKLFCLGVAAVPVIDDITVSATMKDGASIRLNDVNGIRFYTEVDIDKVTALRDLGYTVELGTLIAPVDNIQDKELSFDLETGKYVDVKFNSATYYTEGEFSGIVGSLVNIKDENITRDFVGRGYVKVTDTEGNETITYADYASNNVSNNTRSLQTVATALKNDTSDTAQTLYQNHKDRVDAWA